MKDDFEALGLLFYTNNENEHENNDDDEYVPIPCLQDIVLCQQKQQQLCRHSLPSPTTEDTPTHPAQEVSTQSSTLGHQQQLSPISLPSILDQGQVHNPIPNNNPYHQPPTLPTPHSYIHPPPPSCKAHINPKTVSYSTMD